MAARQHTAERPDLRNDPPCEQALATREQTAALDRQTAKMGELISTIEGAVLAFTPAAEAVADLGAAQRKLCDFIVGNRLKIVGGIVAVLLAVGAISPNAASALNAAFAWFGH